MARGFDGNTANFLSSTTIPVSTRPLTISCRVKVDTIPSGDTTIVYIGDSSQAANNDSWILQLNGTGSANPGEFHFIKNNSFSTDGSVTGTPSYVAGTWASVVGVARSSGSTCVMNDQGWPGGGSTGSPASVDNFSIGVSDALSTINPFDGSIAEVGIWDTNLLEPETYSLQYFSPRLVRPANLIFYAPLINGEDIDIVGGISLTENGTLTNETHATVRGPIGQQ